ncbi:MAG: AAA family ATPase [Candidatus Bathyarchaeia archaeon]|jgi:DNA repair exonuclease SbcCD ATPase subunit
MMKFYIRFKNLFLTCKQSVEPIDFSPTLSVFYGKISSGKSTIARLIDYCLGGELERTPAIKSEMVAVQLAATIGENEVIFERQAYGNQVQVSWTNKEGEYGSVLAPIAESPLPIWKNDIRNLNDLLFYLAGAEVLKIPKSKDMNEEQTVRLSFRNFMWYCYLEQDVMDSAFFWLKTDFKKRNSRYVLDFITGAYTDKLSALKGQLDSVRQSKTRKTDEIESIKLFLEKLGYSSEEQLIKEIKGIEEKLSVVKAEIQSMNEDYAKETHFVDDQRQRLRDLEKDLSQSEQTLIDLRTRINEQDALRAELIASKFKLVRTRSAKNVLDNVQFEVCPECGNKITSKTHTDNSICPLCKEPPVTQNEGNDVVKEDTLKLDLDSRIFELEDSIERQKKAQEQEKRTYLELKERKTIADKKLADALKTYDSNFVAATREKEHEVAYSEERIRNIKRTIEMPKEVNKMENDLSIIYTEEERLKAEIEQEEKTLITSEQLIKQIANSYLEALNEIGLDGINDDDVVEIDRNNWIPYILEHGKQDRALDFFNAGSGGKKTILTVCYALAIHKVAAENNLPLPNFLIIDSPMKNVGRGVNQETFEAFYRYLYKLADGPLNDTQFIIIETDYVEPPPELNAKVRMMNPNDPVNPPLIRYYRGQ